MYKVVIILFCTFHTVSAQNRHDYNWFVATPWYNSMNYGTTQITFYDDALTAMHLIKELPDIDWTNASWSDEDGKFKCLTNGCQILNSVFDTMQNGAGINPGNIHDDYGDANTAYPVTQGAMFLNLPNDSFLYLFHLRADEHEDWEGQVMAVFSPDGRFYVRADGFNGMDVMEFDRCQGRFYNPRHIVPKLPEGYFQGVSISPNSRYLYLSTFDFLEQLDLWDTNLDASRDTIAAYDSFLSPLPTTFYMMQIGPNGKIYMTTGSGGNRLHVINKPDLPGDSCAFVQHEIKLPASYSFCPPNMPNYRLGPVSGNYCDSLLQYVSAEQNEQPNNKLILFPNPSNGLVTITLPKLLSGRLILFNQLGDQIFQMILTDSVTQITFDAAKLSPGTYIVSLRATNSEKWYSKLIIYD